MRAGPGNRILRLMHGTQVQGRNLYSNSNVYSIARFLPNPLLEFYVERTCTRGACAYRYKYRSYDNPSSYSFSYTLFVILPN